MATITAAVRAFGIFEILELLSPAHIVPLDSQQRYLHTHIDSHVSGHRVCYSFISCPLTFHPLLPTTFDDDIHKHRIHVNRVYNVVAANGACNTAQFITSPPISVLSIKAAASKDFTLLATSSLSRRIATGWTWQDLLNAEKMLMNSLPRPQFNSRVDSRDVLEELDDEEVLHKGQRAFVMKGPLRVAIVALVKDTSDDTVRPGQAGEVEFERSLAWEQERLFVRGDVGWEA